MIFKISPSFDNLADLVWNKVHIVQCDTVSYYASPFNCHTMEKSQTNVISVTTPLLRQAI